MDTARSIIANMARALMRPGEAEARRREEGLLHALAFVFNLPFEQARPLILAYRDATELKLEEMRQHAAAGRLWVEGGELRTDADVRLVPFEHELERMAVRLPYSLAQIRVVADFARERNKGDDAAALEATRKLCGMAVALGYGDPVHMLAQLED